MVLCQLCAGFMKVKNGAGGERKTACRRRSIRWAMAMDAGAVSSEPEAQQAEEAVAFQFSHIELSIISIVTSPKHQAPSSSRRAGKTGRKRAGSGRGGGTAPR